MTNGPRTFIVFGMAGAGKTTLCHRLYNWLATNAKLRYEPDPDIDTINLDAAVYNAKMPLTIDVREDFDFDTTMRTHGLGPNGAILACLNLFLLRLRITEPKLYTIIDTPGQIDAFAAAAPGNMLVKIVKNPCILFVVNISLCHNKSVFMSNMIYAASLKARFKCPLIMIFSKSDLLEYPEILDWVRDYEAFKDSCNDDSEAYIKGMVLYFEEFYKSLEMMPMNSFSDKDKSEFFRLVDKVYSDAAKEKANNP